MPRLSGLRSGWPPGSLPSHRSKPPHGRDGGCDLAGETRAATVRRSCARPQPVARRVAAVVVLLLAGVLGVCAGAHAQTVILWSATMTTEHVAGGATGFASSLQYGHEGELTDEDFTHGGETYYIKRIVRDSSTGDLRLEVKTASGGCCPVDLRMAVGALWTLRVTDLDANGQPLGHVREFAIKDAGTQLFGTVFVGIYSWPKAPNWSAHQKVKLTIVTTEEQLPFPELSVQNEDVRESGVPGTTAAMTFTVNVDPVPDFRVGVHYETEDISATGGTTCSGSSPPDYISTEGRLWFGPGEDSRQPVTVTVCDDSVAEPGETFRLVLRSTQLHESISELGKIGPNGKGYKNEDGEDEETVSATGVILDQEGEPDALTQDPLPSIIIGSAFAMESGTGATSSMTFTVYLKPAPNAPVWVTWRTKDGTATGGAACSATPAESPDYETASGTLKFPASTGTEAKMEVDVTVCDDTEMDSLETVELEATSEQLATGEPPVAPVVTRAGYITNSESSTEIGIGVESAYVAEGADAAFALTRAGDVDAALTVPVTIAETGTVLGAPVPANVTFAAGARAAKLRVPTDDDGADEPDGKVIVTVAAGFDYGVTAGADTVSAEVTVLDDDAAVAEAALWAADMEVVDYGTGSIGAGTADLFSNERGTAGLEAKWLWYDTGRRELRLSFTTGLPEDVGMTLHVGDVALTLPASSGGEQSFTWEDVDIAWSDGDTVVARLLQTTGAAVSNDATLASLAVAGATLTPAFDAAVGLYAVGVGADTDTVTVTARANDAGASVAIEPATDAGTELAGHQVAVATGETLITVTVRAADGAARQDYRVVVSRAAANTASTGAPTISGTPRVEETLTADVSAIEDADGLDDVSFAYQWISNSGTDADIEGTTNSTYTLTADDAGKTLKVRVTFTDDKGTEEVLVSAATEPVAAVAPDAPGGLAVATAGGRERELSASWSAPQSDGGSEVTGYRVQWKSGTEAYDGTESSARQAVLGDAATSHTIFGLTNGTAYTVRVLAVNAAGAGAAAEVEATVRDLVAPVLAGAAVDGAVLTLTYSEALDAASKPAVGAFAVTVAGSARTVDAVALSGSAVTLTLASAVAAGETVTVGYTPPTGAGASPLQDATGNDAASFTGEAAANDTPAANTAPTGLPEVSGTPKVGEVLTASVDGITDEDGLDNVTYAYQWLAHDGTNDSEIAGATESTHEVAPAQVGKTLKVRVTFTDEGGTEEVLASAATDVVTARAPDAPGGLTVAAAAGREGELDVSWTAPESDGGSEVTGYKVRWKSGAESYDGSETSTRQTVVSDPTVLTHTITGLTVGTAYTVRVMAVNVAGDGAAAEVAATAEDRVAPVLAASSVNGAALTLTFSEALDTDSKPAAGAFAVSVQGNARTVDAVALSGSAVALTLASAVVADETVTVGYTAPTGTGASPLQDAAGNAVAGFSGAAVSNDTPAGNAKPNGLPAITGTARVGEVLTASADAITDADGLESAAFAWQWLANDGTEDSEIAGATGATHEVAPAQAGQTLKVRVTFTDDKGTEETLVSAATEVVTVPLTAVFENLPPAHDGASIFTFRVRFSESPALSYKVLRDESFAVTGGTVDKARRVDGRNDLREIHVEPAGNGDVTLTLAGGRPCGTHGAICTADGRKLSNTLSATVQGPPALNVADARAVEGQDATLDFVVTLSRAASWTVSVDYATADGSATAGEDYSAASGTLTFNAGETTKTVRVAVLDDVVNDGEETLTLTLSNPSGAWIEDGEATGTIENSDPLPTAWTARFGRSVASHVLDALEARLEAASGSYVRLGGYQLGGAPDVKEAVERLAPPDQVRGRLDNNLSLWEEGAADSASRNMTVQDLLLGSAFHLVSNPDEAAPGPRLSAWGRVATSGFDGKEDRLSLNGTVTTATLGVDGVWEHWLTGVALAYSEGDGSFSQVEAAGGDVDSTLTSVHPYVAYALSDRVRLWGMVGYGSGSLQLKLAEQDAMDTDLAMTMGALGMRGSLLEPSQQEGGMQLAVRSDVLWLRMDSAAVAGMAATEAEVSRLRLVLEGSRPVVLASGGLLIPTLEVGLRHDGGDAETGSGVEVGGSLRYTSAWGLSVEASVRGLLAHEASDYREWGASGALRFDPGQQGLGLTASIVPTWGSAASGVNRLWGQPQASGLAVDNALATAAAGRLDAELGYGLVALQGRGLLTPYARMALSEGSEQAWHLGARLGLAESLNVSLEASRRQREGDTAAHEVALLATLGW